MGIVDMNTWRLFSCLLASSLYSLTAALPQPVVGPPTGNGTYDYVVIGGGTAALVVATRLAQASRRVAVIEAGGFYEQDVGNLSTVPAYAVYGAGTSPDAIIPGVDWGFVTRPQAVSR
jgi:choline dehydrogenase